MRTQHILGMEQRQRHAIECLLVNMRGARIQTCLDAPHLEVEISMISNLIC